jgi:hypothetical protein
MKKPRTRIPKVACIIPAVPDPDHGSIQFPYPYPPDMFVYDRLEKALLKAVDRVLHDFTP